MQGAVSNPETAATDGRATEPANSGTSRLGLSTGRASDWLRTQTRSAHERAEAAVMRRLDLRSQQSYVHYLERVFGVYAPLERMLEALPAYTQCVTDFAERRKRAWLQTDLSFYGRSVAELPECDQLPEPTTVSEALGVAYVFEGATLGGGVLLRLLSFEPRPAAGLGGTFLSGYAGQTSRLWSGFKRTLDERVTRPEHLDELYRGATRAFSAFEHWIDGP